MAPAHIPAWQRLGLKLKTAPSATASPVANTLDAGTTPRKRKFTDDCTPSHSSKTAQPDSTPTKSPSKSKKTKTGSTSAARDTHANGVSSPTPVSLTNGTSHAVDLSGEHRRKSVTFSPDTKTEDGASSKRIVQAAIARMAGVDDIEIDKATAELEGLPRSALGGGANGEGKKGKKAKAKRATPKSKSKTAEEGEELVKATVTHTEAPNPATAPNGEAKPKPKSNKPSAALRYLSEYHSSRARWKFSKVRQGNLLKGLFDLDKTPASYDDALRAYLAGLQGAGIQRKLRGEAEQIVNGEEDDAGDKTEAKRGRARLVLEVVPVPEPEVEAELKVEEMDVDGGSAESEAEAVATANAKRKVNDSATASASKKDAAPSEPQKRKGKRKRNRKRRVASSDESSSSESSDESDASDASEALSKNGKKPSPASKVVAVKVNGARTKMGTRKKSVPLADANEDDMSNSGSD